MSDTLKRFAIAALLVLVPVWPSLALAQNSYLGSLSQVSTLTSTVPHNGDVNPYGMALVPATTGKLTQGHILVSNFNNSANQQGTGTTIVEIAPDGSSREFAKLDAKKLPGPCPGGIGLTTALVALRSGWVIVGSLPTADGTSATAQAGCLLVLNSHGQVVETFSGGDINGPWDMTAFDGGGMAALFVTNVMNGTVAASPNVVQQGTVVRLVLGLSTNENPKLLLSTVIGSGFSERTDPSALVIGPTGVALDSDHDVLYVADSLNNRIAAISNPLSRNTTAGIGSTVSQGGSLNDPLGMVRAPNGDLVAANGDDGNLVEVTPGGQQIATKPVDNTGTPPGAGTLFGLLAQPGILYFVDDGSNTLNVLK